MSVYNWIDKDACTKCWTKEYIIVTEWDWQWFHRGGNLWKVRICDRCFEILESGNIPDENYLCKRKTLQSTPLYIL